MKIKRGYRVSGIVRVGNLFYGKHRSGFDGNVEGIDGIASTLTTVMSHNRGYQLLIEYE